MFSAIIAWLATLIISVISLTGYFGVFALMFLESACIPVPSEIIMPFAGFLVAKGEFGLWPVVLWGAVGNLVGSMAAFVAGYYGGRPLVEKYGKYILMSSHDLKIADGWFSCYGQGTVFFSRLLPVIRTFISLPAGIAKMDFGKFCLYTFLGVLPWSFVLTYAGVVMGENWQGIRVYFEKFEYVVLVAVFVVAVWWVRRHLQLSKQKDE